MAKQTFASALSAARAHLGISLEEATEATGLSKSTLHIMEAGKPCNPTLSKLKQLCDAYDLDLGTMATLWSEANE